MLADFSIANLSDMDESAAFKARHRVLSKEVTKWLKRLRKGGKVKIPDPRASKGYRVQITRPPKFRYICVAEAHKLELGNRPHYHLLIHETSELDHLHKAFMQRKWTLGFSNFKLVARQSDDNGAQVSYITKYLTKDASARVRASASYGLQDVNTVSTDSF